MSQDKSRIYLDYAASAPMRPEALDAEAAYEAQAWAGANPNSLHTSGREAARALDGARRTMATCLGGGFRPSDIVFCSGGTEANNLALAGLAEGARDRDRKRMRVIISAIEHDSVIEMEGSLRNRGFEVERAGVTREGIVDPEVLARHLGDDVALVSIMYANNETGAIQPIPELSKLCADARIPFHTDAVQAFCRVPLDLANVSAASITAHKIGGPVGIGALAVRRGVALRPQNAGGGQEQGRRSGTQDVRGALAFAAAASAAFQQMNDARAATSARADALYQRLCAHPRISATIAPATEGRLPGTVSLLVDKMDSETLILGLDQAGFEVSAGSACSSGSLDASHVLLAMGIPRDQAFGSLRVSFDERVGEAELEAFGDALLTLVG